MKAIQIICALIIAVVYLAPQPAHAQFKSLREKLKKKVEEKVEQKVEEKVEERVDRALDDAIGNTVDSIADNLESSLEGMLFSDAPEPIELGPNETGSPDAPFVRYTLASRIELGGSGLASRLLSRYGAQQDATFTHGDKQRVDTGTESSQIMDAGNRQIIHIDHKRQQWWSMTFEEMLQPIAELAGEEVPSDRSEEPAGSAKITDAKVSVERTGKVESINGSKATQTVMVVEGEYELSGTDEESGETEVVKGKSYVVSEIWQSTDVAGFNTLASYQATTAEEMGAEMAGMGLQSMLDAMSSAPQMPSGTADALSELRPEEGLPVRTKLYFVQVPEGGTLDKKAVLSGSGSVSDIPSEDAAPSQFVIMTLVSEIGDLSTTPFEPEYLEPPSTYEEVESPMKTTMSR